METRVITKSGVLIGFLESYARNFRSNIKKPDYDEYCRLNNIQNNGFIDPRIYREWKSYNPEVFITGEKFIPFKFKIYKIDKADKLTKSLLKKIINFKRNSRYGIKKKDVIDLIYDRLKTGKNSFPSLQNGIGFEGNWIRFSSGSYTERGSCSTNSSIYLNKRRPILITKTNENKMIGCIFV